MGIIVHAVACTKASQSVTPVEPSRAGEPQYTGPMIAVGEVDVNLIFGSQNPSYYRAYGSAVHNALKQLTNSGVPLEDCFVIVTFKTVDDAPAPG